MARSLSLLLAGTALMLASPALAGVTSPATFAPQQMMSAPAALQLVSATTPPRRPETEARGHEAEGEAPHGQDGANDTADHDTDDDHGMAGNDDSPEGDDDHGSTASDDSGSDDSSSPDSADDSSGSDNSADDSNGSDSSDDSSDGSGDDSGHGGDDH